MLVVLKIMNIIIPTNKANTKSRALAQNLLAKEAVKAILPSAILKTASFVLNVPVIPFLYVPIIIF